MTYDRHDGSDRRAFARSLTTARLRCGLLAVLLCVVAGCTADEDPGEVVAETEGISDEPTELREGFSQYHNERFDFRVGYPDTLLIPLGESRNGDGQQFISSDSSVVLTAFGRHFELNVPITSVFSDRIESRRSEVDLVIYSARGDSSFIVIGTVDDRIYYEKSLVYNDTMARIEVTYPIRMQSDLDSVVTHVSDSFGGRIW